MVWHSLHSLLPTGQEQVVSFFLFFSALLSHCLDISRGQRELKGRKAQRRGIQGRVFSFEDIDQILKVGKGKGFLVLRRSIEALIETFQTTLVLTQFHLHFAFIE